MFWIEIKYVKEYNMKKLKNIARQYFIGRMTVELLFIATILIFSQGTQVINIIPMFLLISLHIGSCYTLYMLTRKGKSVGGTGIILLSTIGLAYTLMKMDNVVQRVVYAIVLGSGVSLYNICIFIIFSLIMAMHGYGIYFGVKCVKHFAEK